FLVQGPTAMNVRGVGLLGRGLDPLQQAAGLPNSFAAAHHVREAERARVGEILDVVVAAVNNQPVRVRDLVTYDESGPGVVVGHQPRLGKVGISRPRQDAYGREVRDAAGNLVWDDEEDKVQAIVLMRKGEQTLPTLQKVKGKITEMNTAAGRT